MHVALAKNKQNKQNTTRRSSLTKPWNSSVFVLPHGQLLIAALPNFGFWKWILQRKKKNKKKTPGTKQWRKTKSQHELQLNKIEKLVIWNNVVKPNTLLLMWKNNETTWKQESASYFFFFFFFLKLSMNRFVSHGEPNVKRTRSPSGRWKQSWVMQQGLSSSLCQISMPCVRGGGGGGRRGKKRAPEESWAAAGLRYLLFYSFIFWGGGEVPGGGVGRLYTRCEEKHGSNSSSF